ncbi:Usp domain-containing protein [Citrus sinensis]|uniref:Usp domain-containing protein n=1 Tax=Citrus sinensis TaxID=2711 RepID=A0ACB8KPC7_CITSI|nr:Usp domain-containing protein [Citrus sinensis]
MSSDLGCVIVAVDGSEESMDINNLKLRSPAPGSTEPPDSFIVLHQPSPLALIQGSSLPVGPVNVKSKVVIGDAREKVCELVEKLHVDLFVMGSHTFGPIKRY